MRSCWGRRGWEWRRSAGVRCVGRRGDVGTTIKLYRTGHSSSPEVSNMPTPRAERTSPCPHVPRQEIALRIPPGIPYPPAVSAAVRPKSSAVQPIARSAAQPLQPRLPCSLRPLARLRVPSSFLLNSRLTLSRGQNVRRSASDRSISSLRRTDSMELVPLWWARVQKEGSSSPSVRSSASLARSLMSACFSAFQISLFAQRIFCFSRIRKSQKTADEKFATRSRPKNRELQCAAKSKRTGGIAIARPRKACDRTEGHGRKFFELSTRRALSGNGHEFFK